jgi:hypothetical protein
MKLWLISQDENRGYDTYDSAVVAAETEGLAREVHPGGSEWGEDYGAWASVPDKVSVRLIGEAVGCAAGEVICASFNAG